MFMKAPEKSARNQSAQLTAKPAVYGQPGGEVRVKSGGGQWNALWLAPSRILPTPRFVARISHSSDQVAGRIRAAHIPLALWGDLAVRLALSAVTRLARAATLGFVSGAKSAQQNSIAIYSLKINCLSEFRTKPIEDKCLVNLAVQTLSAKSPTHQKRKHQTSGTKHL